MCLIVLKPKGANNSFTKEKFDNALIANPHGIGIAYSEGGKLVIEKFAQPQSVADKIYEKIASKDAFLIHFRYATHGVKDEVNVHPFIITDDLCVAHNGVISQYKEINKDWSDTKNFVEGVLKPYIQEHGKEVFKSPEFIKMVEEQIGPGSKMVFVDNNMEYSIANEKAGSWIDGCWYSNTYSIEDFAKRRQAAADKKKWASYDNYKYNDYKYDDYDYDYNNYYGNYYDNYGYSGYDEYIKDSMTMDEINEFIAQEVANGYTEGDEIPYSLDVDWDNVKEDADQYRVLEDISKQIEKGVYKGTVPCVWELLVDKEDLEYFLKKEETEKEYVDDKTLSIKERAIKFIESQRNNANSIEYTKSFINRQGLQDVFDYLMKRGMLVRSKYGYKTSPELDFKNKNEIINIIKNS